MEFKEALNRLESSDEIKKLAKDSYLAHGFITLNEKMEPAQPWNIGFYSKKTDKITSFSVTEHVIEELGEQEVFKEPGAIVEKLDAKKIKKTFSEATEEAKKIREEKYKAQTPAKTIVLIQKIKEFGIVWNVTIVTAQFNTLNIKINAENGKLIEDKLTSLMQYKVQS